MIIDCFTFFNELDLLDIRLHELDPWVDRFVLVECPQTYSGNEKPLYFEENKHLFEPFLPKITHLVSQPVDNPKTVWDRLIAQRDYMATVLTDCAGDDLILNGDLDEIPRGRDFRWIHNRFAIRNKNWFTPFMQGNYFFYVNLRRPGGWPGTVLISYENFMSVSTFNKSLHKVRAHRRHGGSVRCGWHFANMGGQEAVKLKLQSSGHAGAKLSQILVKDSDALHNRMEVARAVKGRKLVVEPITEESHPKWFVENIAKFKHLITED